jgi:hypothetical protein
MNLSQENSKFFTFHLELTEEKMEPKENIVSIEENINIEKCKEEEDEGITE